jgi:hypothetical protein
MKIAHLIITLVFFGCLKDPSQISDKYTPDCSTATMPNQVPKDSNKTAAVVEIYDYQMNLIAYSEATSIFASDSNRFLNNTVPNMDIYWNGLDKNGNAVDPGKYIAKLSLVSLKEKKCSCTEIYIQ